MMSTVAFLIITGALLFGIVNEYRQWQGIKEELSRTEDETVILEQRLQRLQILKEQGANLEKQLKQFRAALPDYLDEKELLTIVQRASMAPSSHVAEIRFGEGEDQGGYREIPFKLVFEGDFPGLLQLLTNLEKDAKIFRVNEISIQGSRGDGNIRANLEMAAFCAE